ncbi:tetratricopeptide repeat protein [Amycolatopsis sp. CA-230715]|uniref:tetratricopeptide repeat protein n=1 Tax=Amycolatopsis sp. CA-230715 TaxID=2745196 RepID=UPI001C017CA5|nr:tetratricopeptide repeat protein [Amycolatopsis sp. CA-230715]
MGGLPAGSSLMPPPRMFVNRALERDAFDREVAAVRAGGEQGVFVFTGLPGVGKTSLALWCAGRLQADFDLALQVSMGASSQVLSVEDALTVLLPQLGVDSLPTTSEGMLAAYRAATAGRRLLVFLDDVETPAQVNNLLPASVESMVIATSRRRAEGFEQYGFTTVPVDLFTMESAKELLAKGMEPAAAVGEARSLEVLAELCGRLPLALRIARAHLRTRHRGQVGLYVRQLQSVKSVVTALDIDGEHPVAAIYEVSYRDLSEREQRLYRLLSLHPGSRFSGWVAAALLGPEGGHAVENDVRSLVRASLLTEIDIDRFELHTLVHAHAGVLAEKDHPADQRAALDRLVRGYLEFAVAREQVLSGRARFGELFDGRISPAYEGAGAYDNAVGDLERERANFRRVVQVAADEGFDDLAWQLCEALATFLFQRELFADAIAVHSIGLAAARRLSESGVPDPRALLRMHAELGTAYFSVQNHEAALDHFRRAADLAGELTNDGVAVMHLAKMFVWKAFVHQRRGEARDAVDALTRSRDLLADPRFPAERRQREEVLLDMNGGPMLAAVGRHGEAIEAGRRALAYFTEDKERHNYVKSLANLGESLAAAGDAHYEEAVRVLHDALELEAEVSLDSWRAHSSHVLGGLLLRAGQGEEGERLLRTAKELFERLDDRRAAALREQLDGLGHP